MGLFDENHLVDYAPTAGPSLGFFDSVEQGFEQQFRVDSPLSLSAEIKDQWEQSLGALEQAGQKLDRRALTNYGDIDLYARHVQGQEQGWLNTDPFTGKLSQPHVEAIQRFQQADQAIAALRDPKVKTFSQIIKDVTQMQQEVERNTAIAQETGSKVGQFLGGVGGSITTRDPFNLLTLGFGGVGKTVALRIASEMGLSAALVGAEDVSTVNPNRELAGLPAHNTLYDVALAAAGAGVLRGAGEFIHPRLQSMFDSFRGVEPPRPILAPTTEELQRAFSSLSETSPRARAGESFLRDFESFREANPYGDTEVGLKRFTDELAPLDSVLRGQTDTAMARFVPEMPYELRLISDNEKIVQAEYPDIYKRMSDARDRVFNLDQQIESGRSSIDSTTLQDAVALVDKDAGEKLRVLKDEIDKLQPGTPERAAKELDAQAIVNRVGPDAIMQRLQESETPVKANIQNLKASRKAAKREYSRARKEVEAKIAEVQQRADRTTSRQESLARPVLQGATTQRVPAAQFARYDRVAEASKAYKALDDLKDDEAARYAQAEPDENGLVDLGGEEPIPSDFHVVIEEPDGSVRQSTVGKELQDMRDDAALEEAMRSCAT